MYSEREKEREGKYINTRQKTLFEEEDEVVKRKGWRRRGEHIIQLRSYCESRGMKLENRREYI